MCQHPFLLVTRIRSHDLIMTFPRKEPHSFFSGIFNLEMTSLGAKAGMGGRARLEKERKTKKSPENEAKQKLAEYKDAGLENVPISLAEAFDPDIPEFTPWIAQLCKPINYPELF